MVTGDGRFGSALATHSDVDKVGFTGSTEVIIYPSSPLLPVRDPGRCTGQVATFLEGPPSSDFSCVCDALRNVEKYRVLNILSSVTSTLPNIYVMHQKMLSYVKFLSKSAHILFILWWMFMLCIHS